MGGDCELQRETVALSGQCVVLSEGIVRRGKQLPTVKAEYELIGASFCHRKHQFSQILLLLSIARKFSIYFFVSINLVYK